VPFVSLVVMPAAVAGSLLLPFGLDGPVWQLIGLGSDKVLAVARYVAEFQGSVRGVRAFGEGALLMMSLGFVMLVLIRAPIRYAGAILMAAGAMAAARPAVPDVFVDREGRHAMVRVQDGRLTLVGRSVNRFTTERWLQADGDLRKAADPSLRTGSRCDRWGCVAALPGGGFVSVVVDFEAFEEDCARSLLIITSLNAPEYCRKTAQVIDRETLSFSASLALQQSGTVFYITPARPADRWKPWYGRPKDSTRPLQIQRPAQDIAPETAQPASDDDGADLLAP
jgi:competence protein ComEC